MNNISLLKVMTIIDEFLTEAESDHNIHMIKKKAYANYFGKDEKDLPNKKYKNPESSRKADLKYKYDEEEKTLKSGYTEHPYQTKDKHRHINFKHYQKDNYDEYDSKLTNLAANAMKGNTEKDKKRLDFARKKLLQRVGEDPKNSELFFKNYKGHEIKIKDKDGKIQKGKTPDDIHIEVNKSTKEHDIDKINNDKKDPYVLVHNTDKHLKKIKGQNKSNQFYSSNETVDGGQIHPEKRSYYTIKRKSEANKNDRLGNNNYILNDKNAKKFHFDPEDGNNYVSMRYGPKGDLSGKDVYLTGDSYKVKKASNLSDALNKFKSKLKK